MKVEVAHKRIVTITLETDTDVKAAYHAITPSEAYATDENLIAQEIEDALYDVVISEDL